MIAFNLSDTIDILSRTPVSLNSLLVNLPESWVKNNEGENTWSPYDIIGHLIHGEKTDWIPRAKIILSDLEDKTFEPFDRFAQFENSKGKTLTELLNEFSLLRKQNIDILKSFNLTEAELEMEGNHPDLGKVSMRQLLAFWGVHDLSHIYQISRVLAKNYKSEVGPWSAYISIIQ